ncbi:MAG: thiolase family protein [Gemmatales bacterium]|nr:thiolase family protein [Gemmatales bacterium]MDW8388428.1 thiolase family protein [Gemmatales bacterium]
MKRVAIVEGTRTPFVKAFGVLSEVPADELGRQAVLGLLHQADLAPHQVDQTVFGNVICPPDAVNISRVIALRAGIPQDRIAHTVHRNCASGMEAITTAAQLIHLGEAERIVAGGVESMSQAPLLFSKEAARQFLTLGKARSWTQKAKALLGFRPRHFRPVPSLKLGLTDPICGLIMGETAEVLAEEFGISREEQDRFALESHRRAVAAQQSGRLAEEITPLQPEGAAAVLDRKVEADIGPRPHQTLEDLVRLKPYFRKNGTVTVGNSCQVTDGAVALLLMPEELARAEGRQPLGYLQAFSYAGCDPKRMGLGPVFAVAKLLRKTGLTLEDFELIELNEAFAAQVLACLKAFASQEFARKHLDRSEALGEIDPQKLNVNGGAIALGHPVGATGARLVLTLLKEMRRRNLHRGLATLCVGGGQGAALLLERS